MHFIALHRVVVILKMLLKAHVKKFLQLRIKQLNWLMGFISQIEMSGTDAPVLYELEIAIVS